MHRGHLRDWNGSQVHDRALSSGAQKVANKGRGGRPSTAGQGYDILKVAHSDWQV
jgi:hypothetical protein